MDTFSYSPEEANRQAYSRILPIAIVMAFAAIAILTGTYFVIPGLKIDDLVSSCLILFGSASLVVFLNARSILSSMRSLRITVESDRITKTQRGSNSITISKSQVDQILDIPKQGIRIDSLLPGDSIFIPKDLAGFDRLKEMLFQWRPPIAESNRLPALLFVFMGTIIIAGTLIIIKSTRFYGFALFFLCMFASFIASIVQSIQRHFIRKRLGKQ